MTQPAKAQEPSMEEILASIRRIIADDDTSKGEPASADLPGVRSADAAPDVAGRQVEVNAMLTQLSTSIAGGTAAEPPAADVLELTEAMAAPAPKDVGEGFRTIDGQSDLTFEGEPQHSASPYPAPKTASVPPRDDSRRRPANDADRSLVSAVTSAAVDSAFNTLAHTVLVQNARTLEDLVREMLRPMLKTWLDDNLPGVVERLVRAEIERVSRGRT